ncbi:MAG: ATP-binding protein, partial [Bryobacteraceae bacterium]
VEAGGLTLERTAFDLYEVLGECEATMASAITRKGLQFKMVIHPDTSRFWIGDAERLQQILMNLMGNSVKFTSHGKIELAVRRERSPLGEEGVRFEVTDTGCGVPADKAEMIFEPFQQAEGGIGRAFEGSGLGLAIARTLVSLMSGRIWMEPRPEGGSKFVFTAFFTAVEGNAAPLKTAALSQSHSAGTLQPGTKVLVVEDNQENLILLQAYLQNLFLSLEYASNGLEAVEKCRREDYDLVLMDIQMPIMDGYTATREIRAWEKGKGLPQVPIVALTAHALSGARNQSLEAGCVEHLTKPVDRKDLVEVITRFSKRSAAPVKALEEPLAEGIEALRPAYLAKRKLDLEALREALGVSDFAKIQSMAHNCKGTGRGYGFPEISIAGAALENAAKAQDPAAVEISLQQFERSIGAVVPVGVSAG